MVLRSKADPMITVERKRTIQAPASQIQAILSDIEQLPRLMPRAERVEVITRNENRARVALLFRIGPLPPQRIEGEARLLDDGVRFIAVTPMQIDARFFVQPRGDSTEVIARLGTEIPKPLQPFARLLPHRMIEEKVARDLELTLDALEEIVATQPHEKDGG